MNWEMEAMLVLVFSLLSLLLMAGCFIIMAGIKAKDVAWYAKLLLVCALPVMIAGVGLACRGIYKQANVALDRYKWEAEKEAEQERRALEKEQDALHQE